jgi:hypothetical protein
MKEYDGAPTAPSGTLHTTVPARNAAALLRSVWVAVTAPVMFGNVAFTADLMSRMWSSALFMPSEAAGLDVTRSEM